MQSSKRTLILFGILAVICLFFVLRRDTATPADPIEEMIDEMPQAPEGSSRNEKIKLAFDAFAKYAGKFETPCKGGFINVEEKRLKSVADEIVTNRVVNYHPLEFATTQDEAGITCLSSKEKWVLFSALNTEDESEKPYYCADSSKRAGNFSLVREQIQCGD